MKSLTIRTKILFTAYLTLARQFWWHRRTGKLPILTWVVGSIEYILAILGSLVFILVYPNRSTVVFGIFNWMRSIDDMIDGDNPKATHIDIPKFIETKDKVLKRVLRAKLHEDIMQADIFDTGMAYALIQADSIGIGDLVRTHVSTIWNLMVAERDLFPYAAPKMTLDSFAMRQDKAIGELICVLMGGNISTLDIWWNNRGVFTKIDWMRDIDADIAQGLIHISTETLSATDTTASNLHNNSVEGASKRFICVRHEMQDISEQWDKVLEDRKMFIKSFKNPLMKIIFNTLAIGGFDRRVKRLKHKYNISD
jgi:hypothetical protein